MHKDTLLALDSIPTLAVVKEAFADRKTRDRCDYSG
jgi:hypothetical protein